MKQKEKLLWVWSSNSATQNTITMATQQTSCNCSMFNKIQGNTNNIADLNITNVGWITNGTANDILECPNYNQNANHKYYLRCWDFRHQPLRAEWAGTSEFVVFATVILICLFIMWVLYFRLRKLNDKVKELTTKIQDLGKAEKGNMTFKD